MSKRSYHLNSVFAGRTICRFRIACLLLIGGLFIPCLSSQAAETRYITDQLKVTLRSGEGQEFKILRSLSSGARVTLLETKSASGYSRVSVGAGVEGWVITRYLDTEPSGRSQVARLKKELQQLRVSLSSLRDDKAGFLASNQKLKQRLHVLDGDNQQIQKEVADIRQSSASALATHEENRTLKTQLSTLQSERDEAIRVNHILKDRAAREWFLVGAGVIFLGVIIGLIIPKIRWRRKSSWNSSF